MARQSDTPTPEVQSPWARFAWPEEQQCRIYNDWGLYMLQKEHLGLAENCYDKCLGIKSDDSRALTMRSLCKRLVARTESALEDARLGEKYDDFNPPISAAICDALYELNDFENCKAEWHNNIAKFGAAIKKKFTDRLVVVDQNLENCLGDSLGSFIIKHGNKFQEVLEAIKAKERVYTQPLWKILKEQEKCDVLSIPDEEFEELSPLQLARRERWFRIFHQLYFWRNWRDVIFMRNLIKNDGWVLPQHVNSKVVLRNLLVPNYDVVRKFVIMLHHRSPIYTRKFGSEKLMKKQREEFLNWMQYRTRRTMIIVLRTLKLYRKSGDVERMTKYVEEVMGNYVVLKTHRLMPWKFEFINEVYNTLALARSDEMQIPKTVIRSDPRGLAILLKLPIESADRQEQVVFGERNMADDPAASAKQARYFAFLNRMEKRQRFAKYSIEKCYLLHETAYTHLVHGKHEKCVSTARKAIEETRNCNSILYAFLSMMLIVKAHAALRKVEYCKDALADAYVLAKILRNNRIIEYVELCDFLNEGYIKLKHQTHSLESMRKRKLSMSSSDFDPQEAEQSRRP